MLTERKRQTARRALQKRLDEDYNPTEQDSLEWSGDTETNGSYSWHFIFPGDGKKRTFTYIFQTKSVMIRRVD